MLLHARNQSEVIIFVALQRVAQVSLVQTFNCVDEEVVDLQTEQRCEQLFIFADIEGALAVLILEDRCQLVAQRSHSLLLRLNLRCLC